MVVLMLGEKARRCGVEEGLRAILGDRRGGCWLSSQYSQERRPMRGSRVQGIALRPLDWKRRRHLLLLPFRKRY